MPAKVSLVEGLIDFSNFLIQPELGGIQRIGRQKQDFNYFRLISLVSLLVL